MRLSDLLKPANIKHGMVAKNKTEAIAELVGLLSANHEVTHAKKVLDAVLERESTRTTGIGKAATPIDFQAIDGRPVTWIWLLSSPPDKTGPHIHALARISRLMTIDSFRQTLATAKSAQDVFDIIQKQENSL